MDPITAEIVRHGLRSTSKRMVTTLVKTAYSSVIYDGKDCSCAILDSSGQLLSLDAGLPMHIGPMPFSVKEAIKEYPEDIHPGDIFITNYPYHCTHIPDVLILLPIFYQGRLLLYSAARGHWTDAGGSVPGSLSGKATEIHQEGLIIPPVKLYEKGKLNRAVLALILSNVRVSEQRSGDIRAQISACKVGEQECIRLMDKYGPDTVVEVCREMLTASESYIRRRIRESPQFSSTYEDFLDSDGNSDIPLRIKVRVTIAEDDIEVDFTGSSPQCHGPYNASLAMTWSAVMIALKIAFDPQGPTNEGVIKPVRLYAPEGSLVNAKYPAATGGSTEVAYRSAFAILGALSGAMAEAVSGSDYGTVNHCYISTVDAASGERRIYYVFPPGGNGGTYRMDGPSGFRGPLSGDVALESMEMVETAHPLLFRCLRFRTDSGGAGQFRGGMGLELDVELLSQGQMSIVTDRCEIPPFGLFGGGPGLPQEWRVFSGGKAMPIKGGKTVNYPLQRDDVVSMRTAGGGGYGDPLERDPEMVREDVRDQLTSLEQAAQVYGVVLNRQDFALDASQTKKKRRQLRAQRQLFTVRSYGAPHFKGVFRVIYLPASNSQFPASQLVELVASQYAAPLRVQVALSEEMQLGEACLDEEAMEILGLAPGDMVWIRALRAPGAQLMAGEQSKEGCDG